ncbi:TnsD domain-containing protein [Pseudomonas sp. IT-P100]
MERLLAFPKPLPDESLYSVAVRYHRTMANDSYRKTSLDLFGAYSRTCGSTLPCCLGHLSARLGGLYSVQELVEAQTLLPLYKPFLQDGKYESAVRWMEGGIGTGLKMSMGITASGLLKHESFRYCEACVQDDIQDFGVPYWHRIHMAAGVCACPHHGSALRSVHFPSRSDWRCMLLPGECLSTPVTNTYGLRVATHIAEMQFWGLSHSSYVADLVHQGFLKSRLLELGMLKKDRLIEKAIKAHVERRFWDAPQENDYLTVIGDSGWVLRLLRPRGQTVQPFRFYFLCWLLGATLDDLSAYESEPPEKRTPSTAPNLARKTVASEKEIAVRRRLFTSDCHERCHEKTGYYWLYHNDRGWLKNYLNTHQHRRIRKPRVDWKVRDTVLSEDLVTVHRKIMLQQGKPVKLTKSAIVRSLPYHFDFLRQPANFPKSMRVIQRLIETEHDYQVRKIRWAMEQCHRNKYYGLTSVLRIAGIRVRRISDNEIRKITDPWMVCESNY